jgi:hypothetical protein
MDTYMCIYIHASGKERSRLSPYYEWGNVDPGSETKNKKNKKISPVKLVKKSQTKK